MHSIAISDRLSAKTSGWLLCIRTGPRDLEAVGWHQGPDLPPPSEWEPSVYAYSLDGGMWHQATGGNARDGATRWDAIDDPRKKRGIRF